jgi:glycosyltransferase involved in cell wall biosynthesis
MPASLRPRVLLLIPHLGGGGAERVTALLARALPEASYEKHLCLVTDPVTTEAEDLIAHGVQVHTLGARRVRGGTLRLLMLVRRLRPAVILSGMAHLNFLVLLLSPLFPSKTRILVRQNSTASAALEFGGLPVYTRILYKLLYRHAHRVICQTEAMARDLARELGVPGAKLAVLPNPVDVAAIRMRANQASSDKMPPEGTASGPHLLAIGRLSREKGFDLLLEALALVRQSLPQTTLAIAGSGPEGEALKKQSRELGLQAAVCFLGHVADPAVHFASASVFVLSSRHEGLPNVLLEAAAGGLPIVALPSSEGVADLLRGQPGVCLAPEVSADALAQGLLDALHTLQPGERFRHPFIESFRLERAVEAYAELIDSVLAEGLH